MHHYFEGQGTSNVKEYVMATKKKSHKSSKKSKSF
jgi:hypothetical protein